MHCPTCNAELLTTDLSACGLVVVARCPQCAGTWFDGPQTQRLGPEVVAEVASTPVAAAESRPAMQCPRCAVVELTAVTPTDAQNLAAHRCGNCGGFWMDRLHIESLSTLSDDEHSAVIDRKSVEFRPSQWSALRWIGWRLRRCFE